MIILRHFQIFNAVFGWHGQWEDQSMAILPASYTQFKYSSCGCLLEAHVHADQCLSEPFGNESIGWNKTAMEEA